MEVVKGDITKEKTDVIVNSTNDALILTEGNCFMSIHLASDVIFVIHRVSKK